VDAEFDPDPEPAPAPAGGGRDLVVDAELVQDPTLVQEVANEVAKTLVSVTLKGLWRLL
jgi:hypothetical protein